MELGPPTQHFDFHGQGHDVIEFPWFAAEQPWGGTQATRRCRRRHRLVPPAPATSTDCRLVPGVSDNLLVTESGGEWLSRGWSHEWREIA